MKKLLLASVIAIASAAATVAPADAHGFLGLGFGPFGGYGPFYGGPFYGGPFYDYGGRYYGPRYYDDYPGYVVRYPHYRYHRYYYRHHYYRHHHRYHHRHHHRYYYRY